MASETEALVAQFQGLVRSIALKVHSRLPRSVCLDDLIGYGQIGLVQAAAAYQPTSGVTFSTFAYYRIRGSVYDGLGHMTGWSRRAYRKIRFEQRASEHLEEQATAAAGDNGVVESCRWLFETTHELAVVFSAITAAELHPDDEPDPCSQLEQQEILVLLRQGISELPEPEQSVIKLAYFEGLTLSEIAKQFGKDKSWASRCHSRVLATLSKKLGAVSVA